MCSSNSCGLEKTAHNILLYKLKLHRCQHFITDTTNYFSPRLGLVERARDQKVRAESRRSIVKTLCCDFRLALRSVRA